MLDAAAERSLTRGAMYVADPLSAEAVHVELQRLRVIADTAQALVDAWDDDANVDQVFGELRALLPPTPPALCPGPTPDHGCSECRSGQELDSPTA